MAFVSAPFLLFVACTVLIYYLVPSRFRWGVVLAASLIFYWVNSHWLILILAMTSAVTYGTAVLVQRINSISPEEMQNLKPAEKRALKSERKKKSGAVLKVGILLDLAVLLLLKYSNFFLSLVSSVAGGKVPELHLLLPLGISFYTLQAIGYMVDVHRGKTEAETNYLKFLLFMSYFPQIVQGPIPRFRQLAGQFFEEHPFDLRQIQFGMQLVLWGFMKKTIIADRLAVPVNELFDNSAGRTGLIVFLAAVGYGLQVYADFSGGMDIAAGVSQMLGIRLEANFKQPYFATSIEDFWRRWHITLGAWMREYIFYPLSLSKAFGTLGKKSRKLLGAQAGKRLPAFLSMFIVYFLVGFWHGPNWKYIAYGIWNGVFIMAGILLTDVYAGMKEKCRISDDQFSWRAFQMIRTFVLCSIGRFFSRANDLPHAMAMIGQMTENWWDLSFLLDGSLVKLGLDTANWILLLIAILVLFLVDSLHEKGVSIRESIAAQPLVFRWLIYYAAFFAVLIFGIYGPLYDSTAFIYEQF